MTTPSRAPSGSRAQSVVLMRRGSPKVLVVDDEPVVRELTQSVLESMGFEVTEASNGVEALEAFDRAPPDLVTLDVHMGPGLDGFETCRKLRARPAGEVIPIVMLTEDDTPETIQGAYDCGATDFEQKGVLPVVLGNRLRFLYRAKETLDELRNSELRLETAQQLARLGSWEWSARDDTHTWSRETYRLLDIDPGVARPNQNSFLAPIHPEDRPRVDAAMQKSVATRDRYELEYRLVRSDGTTSIVQHRGEPILDHGDVIGLCGTVQEITELRQAEERIRQLVYHDPLTELPNRALFFEQADNALAVAKRHGTHVAIIFLDLDGFKAVNDAFGHDSGDRLLKEASARLRTAIRETDAVSRPEPEGEPTLCRLGGDEFVVLLSDVRRAEDVGSIAWRLVESLRPAFDVCGQEIFVTGSAGAAVHPQDGEDPRTLLKHSDAAMYASKEAGRNRVTFFDPALNARISERLSIVSGLHRALRRNELELHYQPIVDATSDNIVAAECLVRWNDPERGLIYPGQFISVAEDTGLIVPLSEWVIRTACEQQQRWLRQGILVPLSVNISSRHFDSADVAHQFEETGRDCGVDLSGLTIEITESLFLRDTETTQQALTRLKALGLSIALDDFGTGYSSLSYLRRFPVDRVKVDRAFVSDLEANTDAVALVEAIALLAHRLGIEPLAEGVETERQREILQATGYRMMQGFLFSRAVPATVLTRLLGAPGR